MTFDDRLDMPDALRAVLGEFHERIAAENAGQGGPHSHMAVGPSTGRLLNVLARSLESPTILELGTSLGYSTVWLADAARATNGHVITMELEADKAASAKAMISKAELAEWVTFQVGDSQALIPQLTGSIDFVLVDHWKDLYLPSFELFKDKLAPGAILIADNMLRGGTSFEDQQTYAAAVRACPGFTSILLPVGSGLEVSRYEPH